MIDLRGKIETIRMQAWRAAQVANEEIKRIEGELEGLCRDRESQLALYQEAEDWLNANPETEGKAE